MSVTIELSPETTARLRAEARVAGLGLDVYIAQLIERTSPPTPLDQALQTLISRTPEQRSALRAQVMAASRPARPLPQGKSLEDMVVGSWPGDESDSLVTEALKELS